MYPTAQEQVDDNNHERSTRKHMHSARCIDNRNIMEMEMETETMKKR